MVLSKSVTFLCVTCTFAALVAACDPGIGTKERCEALPTGGCGGNSLAVCADPACAFVAACDLTTGRWTTVGPCARDGGVTARDGSAGDGGAQVDASTADGGPASGGACPALQPPDCSEATRAACGPGCCGCEDVFRCESGGWTYVGPCVP